MMSYAHTAEAPTVRPQPSRAPRGTHPAVANPRHVTNGAETSPTPEQPLYVRDDLTLDFEQREARRGDEEVALSDLEWDLLAYLMERRGQTVSRPVLQAEVWGCRPSQKSRVVDLAVHKLRKKIEVDSSVPRHIHTIYRRGYRLTQA